MTSVQAVSLTPRAYRAYGDVVSVRSDIRPRPANLGTADRYDQLAALENRRPRRAKPNLCLFHSRPQLARPKRTFEAKLLEKHPASTQVFIPMGAARRYLVLVCLGGGSPDLSTFRAFVATGAQGVTYRPGVWHHPLIAMDRPTDFACLVWEDGTRGDTAVVRLPSPVLVRV
ncbi:MAG: ureidoglycolate lyase [Elusimicrobia bacterium]|nr:ureidoglycolate lyase [Elusimicrobiota bacterium]